jgi:small ligand-binding sensory domain FIST
MEGPIIYELDGEPIVRIIDELYESRDWREERPVNFLTIGKYHGEKYEDPVEGRFVNRLITGCLPGGDGIAIFEPDFEPDTEIQFMLRDTGKMIESARENAAGLMEEIEAQGKKAFFGLYIDCAGRAAKYSNTTVEEAAEVQAVLNQYGVPFLGFYSGVEVAPLLGKSRGLDWTGVLLILAGEQ